VTYFLNCVTPSISREWLEQETPNLHADSSPGVLTKEMQNWVKRRHERVTWPTFDILGPPSYLGNG